MKNRLIFSALIICSTLILSACNSARIAQNPTKILDDKATVMLPKGFVKMSKDMLEMKYPEAQRPQEVWYTKCEGGKVSIDFSLTDKAVSESQVSKEADAMQQQLSAYSSSVSNVTVNGKKMARIEIFTRSEDGKFRVYKLMQLSSLEGKLLVSTFNVTEDLQVHYAQSGKDALSTLSY